LIDELWLLISEGRQWIHARRAVANQANSVMISNNSR